MIQTVPSPLRFPQPTVRDHYDVIVIGAGPAGCTTAALVAQSGRSVLLLERESVPRFHVGESLIPHTYGTLQRLGLLDRIKAAGFPVKYSVQFVTETGKVTAPFYFDEYIPHESSVTWQVERGVFDKMLAEQATRAGAVLREGAHVSEVVFDGDRATGVRVKLAQPPGTPAESREIHAQVVVDATGQSSFLASRLQLKQRDPRLQKATVWTYYQGALRDPGKDEGATLIMQTPGKKSWFWYIPLANDIVSVGCTGSLKYMFSEPGQSAQDVFERELSRCEEMTRRVGVGQRVTQHFTTRDFSYQTTRNAGQGWVLVGDAGGFIDPVYSSGVKLALASGEFAADAIVDAFATGDFSAEQLGRWVPTYKQGLENFRRLVYAFYTPGFSFGCFLMDHPQYRSNMVDILMGDVFKPGVDAIFDAMGEVVPPPDIDAPVEPAPASQLA